MKNTPLLIASTILLLSCPSFAATVAIGAGTYTQNFNTLAASQEPAAGWDVRTGANATALGSPKRSLPNFLREWTHNTGQFKNVSSTNIAQTSDIETQAANTDRALAVNQAPTFGDPGVAFNFNFSTTGVRMESLSIDLLLLNNVQASTTFTIQFGIGATPASFMTLGTWSDADVTGGWGSSTLTFDREDFGSSLDFQSQAWFRVVTLSAAATDGSSGARDMMGIDNFSAVAAVPEPSVMLLGCLGVLGFFGARRR